MLRRALGFVVLAMALLAAQPASADAALTPQVAAEPSAAPSSSDYLEAREYRITDARIAGVESARQTITAWQVTQGSWNGETLDGLGMVLVQTQPDDSQTIPTTNCYVSHLATPAQRNALLNAFVAAQNLKPPDATAWRIEPAVIKFEFSGQTVILHIGAVA